MSEDKNSIVKRMITFHTSYPKVFDHHLVDSSCNVINATQLAEWFLDDDKPAEEDEQVYFDAAAEAAELLTEKHGYNK